MKIIIGCDHAGPALKDVISAHLSEMGHEVIDFGVSEGEKIDYPLMGERVGDAIVAGEADFGVLICGTGLGISIAANKVPGVIAACVSEPTSARLAREHNGANIIAFGARIVGEELACDIVDAFFGATPLGDRHERRRAIFGEIEARHK